MEKIRLHSFKLYSHPQKPLFEHLKNVGNTSRRIVNSKFLENRELFAEISYLIGVSHDFGKSTKAFQKMLKTGMRSEKARHGLISSLFGYFLIKNFLEKREKLDKFWYIPPISWIVINKHHGDINDIRDEINKLRDQRNINLTKEQLEDIKDYNELEEIYGKLLTVIKFHDFNLNSFFTLNIENLMRDIYRNVKKLKRVKNLDFYFRILFFYSVLLDADKLDASGTKVPSRIALNKRIVDEYKSFKFKRKSDINNVRERAYLEANRSLKTLNIDEERILSINLPTGVGKTLTGFAFALGLREKVKLKYDFEPKIIYSLPFLSIIDQNASIISQIFDYNGFPVNSESQSNLLLKHHHLADVKYKEISDNELYVAENINSSILLTEGWHSEIIITTFIQFFHSLITNRNRAARKFHNIVNSIIILDEIQSIPHKYWLIINKTISYLTENFNCWVILMTATKPLIFAENETKEIIEDRKSYFKYFDRVEFKFRLGELDFSKFQELILKEVNKRRDEDIMIVLNTIRASRDLYNYLKGVLCRERGLDPEDTIDDDGICELPDLELINMSTHVLPFYRLARIRRIREDNKRKIIITTQLVEAGVDISVDVIYRDMAPLDSIIQTGGRCNRNYGSKKGEVNVVLLKDENNRLFSTYIYDPLLISITKEVLGEFGDVLSEKDFTFNAANEYYQLLKERGSQDESRELIDHLKSLNFSETSNFSLIENVGTFSVFIELNSVAKECREKMEEIMKAKDFSKKWKLREIRKSINNFTLSVNYAGNDLSQLPPINNLENFRYVPIEILKEWYKPDVGFQPPLQDISIRIL
ncbi:CRISPR-associated endonuclease Cas3'' [Methanothermobacter sp.]|uniref:CRISPR-associated endonuclease Cas3'' n=1 Tax=Methanothermobacter sp. TaxID=1884223 RepID=UPI002609A27A|nr:CRISPR-associated endonuclease Cas3'' [Methanothermobacter sp.]MDI9619145.1 CRISPR-associated endonuclease Cas3'' [Methanothermobacter sp.]